MAGGPSQRGGGAAGPPGRGRRRVATGLRRGRRPAGVDRRPLCRPAGRAVPGGRGRGEPRGAARRAGGGHRLRRRVRPLRQRRTDPRRTAARRRRGARRRTAAADRRPRARPPFLGRRSRRTQDRLLHRPARQPRTGRHTGQALQRPTRPSCAGTELLLLHGRLLGGDGRRRRRGAVDRLLGRGARPGARELAPERAARVRRPLGRGQRLRRAAHAARRRSFFRPDRAGPAEVRRQPPPRRAGRARLQGHQPLGAAPARPRPIRCA